MRIVSADIAQYRYTLSASNFIATRSDPFFTY